MCGIAGLVGENMGAADAEAVVGKMCRRMAHRGPDGGGVHAAPGATLGMRRLAIVDVENGRQPMANDDGSIVLVYNGEIYNARALRAELQAAGVRFRTKSDTEVVLRLYERDPARVESELVGMWAFAIHDRRRGRVVLSRDRFGIKPLFYVVAGNSVAGQSLAFASELVCFSPLRANAVFKGALEVDPAAAQAMLAWSYVPGEGTILRGVKRLSPGCRLEMATRGDAAPNERRYYSARPDAAAERVSSLEEAAELTGHVLRRSVREHLESDVPVATFLSGGVDSSLVAAYAAEAAGAPLEAFTIGFESKAFDEAPAARFAASRLGAKHNVDVLDEDTLIALVAPALLAYDEPFGDSSSIATFALCSRVGRHYKVALGGDGGDEAFAGYRKHHVVAARHALQSAPKVRELLARALLKLPARGDRSQRHTRALRTLRRLGTGLGGDDAQAYAALTQVATLADVAPLVADHDGTSGESFLHEIEALYRGASGPALRRTLLADLGGVLPNDMLTKVDRASMAVSLEARVPLLDHRVVEVGLGLPARFTLGRSGKEVLRLLCARAIGPEHARLPKRGFSVPIERWLEGRIAGACDRLFATERLERYGVLAPASLSNGAWRTLARCNSQTAWNALALAVWCERHLGGEAGFVQAAFAGPRSSADGQGEPYSREPSAARGAPRREEA